MASVADMDGADVLLRREKADTFGDPGYERRLRQRAGEGSIIQYHVTLRPHRRRTRQHPTMAAAAGQAHTLRGTGLREELAFIPRGQTPVWLQKSLRPLSGEGHDDDAHAVRPGQSMDRAIRAGDYRIDPRQMDRLPARAIDQRYQIP